MFQSRNRETYDSNYVSGVCEKAGVNIVSIS